MKLNNAIKNCHNPIQQFNYLKTCARGAPKNSPDIRKFRKNTV